MSDYDNMREELMIKEIESLREANQFHQQTEKDYRGEIATLKEYKLKWQELLKGNGDKKKEYEEENWDLWKHSSMLAKKLKESLKREETGEKLYFTIQKKFISYKKRIKKERLVWKEELNGKNGKK